MTAVPVPAVGVRVTSFDLDHRTDSQEIVGGRDFVSGRGLPKWMVSLETPPLDRAQAQSLRAWWNGQKGGLNTMLLHHPEQAYPLAYPLGFDGLVRAAGGAFDGTASLNALAANSVTVQGLPAGFVLKAGDLFGLVEGGKYGLFEVAGDVTANASGIAVLVPQPMIWTTVFTTAAQVTFDHCVAEFRVHPDSWSSPRSVELDGARFTARQVGY